MSVSTHVLDTSLGRPAAGVPVQLEARIDGQWQVVGQGSTNADGRISGWQTGAGTHRLVFDVAAYHVAESGVERGFYPEVVVVFRIADASEHHHIPLLLSPYGYSTYRGS